MILTKEKRLHNVGSDAKKLEIADSVANAYVPIHAGFEGTVVTKVQGLTRKKVLLYNEVEKGARAAHSSNKEEYLKSFLLDMRMVCFGGRRPFNYYIRKGMVYFSDIRCYYPLLMLTIDRKYLFEMDWNNPDYSKICLMIDYRYQDKEHVGLRSMFNQYIKQCTEAKVTLLYTTDIRAQVYKRSYEYPTFDTVDEMKQYLKSLNNLLYDSQVIPSNQNQAVEQHTSQNTGNRNVTF